MDPPGAVTCQVCGEAVGGDDAIACSRCGIAQHPDCWGYARRCATYGCEPAPDEPEPPRAGGPTPEGSCGLCARRIGRSRGYFCPGCARLYHEACLRGNGGCTRAKCRVPGLMPRPGAGATLLPVPVRDPGGQGCRTCHGPIPESFHRACPDCGDPFHRSCFELQGCRRPTCIERRLARERVHAARESPTRARLKANLIVLVLTAIASLVAQILR